jgi:holo-[acyl-carrier protein] synthase
MIIGIGVDLADSNRIERMLVEYGSRFAERILAPSERAAYRISSRPTWFVANRFAAKEALSKALGTGLRFPVTLHTISVIYDAVGKPELRFHGALPEYLAGRGVSRCHLTLSHERDLACAMVVVEG